MGISHEDRPYISRRQFLTGSAAAGAVATAGPWLWTQPAYASAVPVSHQHLQYGADAAHRMTVSWRTTAPVRRPFVEIEGERIRAETRQYPGYRDGWFHSVPLRGLSAATTYRYRIGHAGDVRSSGKLTTGPRGRERFTFTGFGDQGYSASTSGRNDAHNNTLLAQRLDPALHLIVGDLAYANGDQTIWDQWFGMVSPMARRRPWMPCIGNHEIESQLDPAGMLLDSWGDYGYDPYRTRFDLPGNGHDDLRNCFYRFRYGSVEFVSIDNNDVTSETPINVGYTGGRQRAWVERALAAAAADRDVDFIVVLMHQCAFSSSSKHGSDLGVQKAWFDLFAKYQVDLVLQGHDHTYERTHAMRGSTVVDDRNNYRTDTGTVYIVVGNGGAVQEPFKPAQPEWSAKRVAGRIGTLRVDVDPFAPKGMRRLVLGEYAAADGTPIEKGVVLERPARTTSSTTETSVTTPAIATLPGIAALSGFTATGVDGRGDKPLSVTVGRLREADDVSGALL